MEHRRGQNGSETKGGMGSGYPLLALALTLSLAVMFPLSMAFVDRLGHFYLNLSNFYMAVTMVAPMGLIMLAVMHGMFPDRRINIALAVGFVALFFLGLWLGRTEALVGDEQFLKAMIPHHSRAVLVCQEADIDAQDIRQLCDQIIATQLEEIAIMERMLDER